MLKWNPLMQYNLLMLKFLLSNLYFVFLFISNNLKIEEKKKNNNTNKSLAQVVISNIFEIIEPQPNVHWGFEYVVFIYA